MINIPIHRGIAIGIKKIYTLTFGVSIINVATSPNMAPDAPSAATLGVPKILAPKSLEPKADAKKTKNNEATIPEIM